MKAYKVTYKNKSLFAEGKYCLRYKEGEITEALPGTIGIMCLKTLTYVNSDPPSNNASTDIYEIYEVEGYGIKTPSHMAIYITEHKLNRFYDKDSNPDEDIAKVPDGMVCFESVKVLRKINIGNKNESI